MSLAPLMRDDEIAQALGRLDGWERVGDTIAKSFRWRDFKDAVDFVVRITPVADELYHHPDVAIHWDTVRVSLWSHEEGGITVKDFELAPRIDALGAESRALAPAG